MTHDMKCCLPAVALTIALAGCSNPATSSPSSSIGPMQLKARLLSPMDIELTWHNDEPDAAGRIVEWAVDPAGEYNILAFLTPAADSFVHPDLTPDTACYYRVRPYF